MNPQLDTTGTSGAAGDDASHARAVAAGFDSYIEEVADRRHQLTDKGVITPAGRLSESARSSMDPDLADLVDLLFSGSTPVIDTDTPANGAPADAAMPIGPMPALPPDQALEVLKDQYPTKSPEGTSTQPGPQGEGQ